MSHSVVSLSDSLPWPILPQDVAMAGLWSLGSSVDVEGIAALRGNCIRQPAVGGLLQQEVSSFINCILAGSNCSCASSSYCKTQSFFVESLQTAGLIMRRRNLTTPSLALVNLEMCPVYQSWHFLWLWNAAHLRIFNSWPILKKRGRSQKKRFNRFFFIV